MRIIESKLIFSPTDLSTFFRSPYVSWLSHYNLLAPKAERIEREQDATQTLLAKKGNEFEQTELNRQKSSKKQSVVEITGDGSFDEAARKTFEAMKNGADIIYQAALQLDTFQGYADFLLKIPGRASKLGDYSYEVADTKLSHSPKPEYALQICCYSEMLVKILGHWPEKWHLMLGDGSRVSFPVSDYRFYYSHFKNVFVEFHSLFSMEKRPFPEPWENVTGYEDHVEALFKKADHLCLVAGVGLSQVRRLKESKIETRASLAKAVDKQRPRRMQPHVFEKIREQAALQIQSEAEEKLAFRILDHAKDEAFGLARLPTTDDGDVIFDMEGYPLQEGGFEYLFGVLVCEREKWNFREWTAHDISEEKDGFEKFMDWLVARYKKFPKLHVYHYASYEPSALANLSNKYGTRVAEVDLLLANKVFVDLYQVVREGVRVGASSYSIKKVEALYDFNRKSDVTTAGDSIVQFHDYLELRVADPKAAEKILADIVEYNKEDVESTLELRDWLLAQKKKHKISSVKALAKLAQLKPTPDWERIRNAIVDSPPKWIKKDIEHLRVSELVADLAGYFHREDRPIWWAYFSRESSSPEDLLDDAECLALATVEGRDPAGVRISFDPDQSLKIKDGQGMSVKGQSPWHQVTIEKLDLNAGTAVISGGDFSKGTVITLIPGGPLKTDSQKQVLISMATRWEEQTAELALTSAALDILHRRPPRIKGIKAGAELYPVSEVPLEAALRIAIGLDGSCLSIQGPPGTGKTYTGGYIIAHLLKEGKRVAVVSQGRKTVENLLQQTVEWWRKLYPKQKLPNILMADNDGGGENPCRDYRYASNSDARNRHGSFQLLGATHFVFSKPELQTGSFDYLFIDEAGQFSLAAAVVCSFAAKNLVLLGDQMQLEQVNVGQHPGESGLSVLNYYMNGQNTIPRTHGVFLDETWRMNPSISQLISHLVYDDRLRSNKRTEDHELETNGSKDKIPSSGIVFFPVNHSHNSMRSEEEVDAIEEILKHLKGTTVPSEDGKNRKFSGGDEDLIVITPYNAQVELIRSRIKGARVGSVDLFQGQEAWVSILSMCASGEEGLHRGLEFLLSKNRMNVGLSRAKALSIVVGSPRLLEIRPRNIKVIPLLNFYAALTRGLLS